jgi:hypothetical protein
MIGLLRLNRRNNVDRGVALCALSFLISFCVMLVLGKVGLAMLTLLMLYGLLKLFGY